MRTPRVAVEADLSTRPSAGREDARFAEFVASRIEAFVMADHDDGAQNHGLVDVRDVERHAEGATVRRFATNL